MVIGCRDIGENIWDTSWLVNEDMEERGGWAREVVGQRGAGKRRSSAKFSRN